jgi:hypothetical protein
MAQTERGSASAGRLFKPGAVFGEVLAQGNRHSKNSAIAVGERPPRWASSTIVFLAICRCMPARSCGRENRDFISERSTAAVRFLRFIHHFAVNCTGRNGQSSLTLGDIASALEDSMLAVFGRRKRFFGVLAWALFAAVASAPARADTDMVIIHVDQAQLLKLPDRVATVVIGNPLIADATLQSGGILVVTGKGYGATNLMALDRNGRVIMNKPVQVLGPSDPDLVVLYNGSERESYSCAPQCQPRITLGDSAKYFQGNLTQTGARNHSVQSDSAGPGK